MGGASAQIAYEAEAGSFPAEKTVATRLYGQEYLVRATSNLCWGGGEAIHRHQAILIIHSGKEATEINDPCLNEGATRSLQGSELDNWVCVESVNGAKYYDGAVNYTFKGVPNVEQCASLVWQMLDLRTCKQRFKYCFEEEEKSPPASMTFMAFSTYYYATRALVMKDSISLADFQLGTKSFCEQPWERILSAGIHKAKYAIDFCLLLNYMRQTLSSVYKFEEAQWPNIKFVRKIEKQSIGWALGLMINSTNAISPLDPTPPVIEVPLFTVFMAISMVLLVISIFFYFKKKTVLTGVA